MPSRRERSFAPVPEQNDRSFADDIFKCIMMTESFCMIPISLQLVTKYAVDSIGSRAP